MLSDTSRPNAAARLAKRFTIDKYWLAWAMFLSVAGGITMPVVAQSDTTINENQISDGARTVPAPWRPSFGPLNQRSDNLPTTSNLAGSEDPLTMPPAGESSAAAIGQSLTAGGSSSGVFSAAATVPVDATFNSVVNANNQEPPRQRGLGQDARSATITRVSKSLSRLPNDAGQIWREYDITPYTSKITSVDNPQQAILDWILKETGTEMWFNQPLGILNSDRNQLRVYHTPEIHRVVHQIVDRFVNTRGQVQDVEVSLITVSKPNWRESAYTMLQPIEVQSPGVEAWMITKENAAQLLAQLRSRPDFKEHGTGKISHHDGQTVSLKNTRPVQFVRNLRWVPNSVPSYQPLMTNIDEGYSLEISSLSSIDGKTIEATIKADVDQVERLNTVKVSVPGVGRATDRVTLQIPELVSWRVQERFRWPNDQVLLMSCGVVASPEAATTRSGGGLQNLLSGGTRQRADALMFIDYRGPQLPQYMPPTAGQMTPSNPPFTAPVGR